jgi:hypothetical protein
VSLARRLEAQEGEIARLSATAATRACDGELRGRLSLVEERLLSQEAALEVVRAVDLLQLKGSVTVIQSALSELSERPREGGVDLAVEVADLRSSLAAVERENARLAFELLGVAEAISSVRRDKNSSPRGSASWSVDFRARRKKRFPAWKGNSRGWPNRASGKSVTPLGARSLASPALANTSARIVIVSLGFLRASSFMIGAMKRCMARASIGSRI